MKRQILMVHALTEWYDINKPSERFINLNLGFLRIATICDKKNIGYSILDFNNGNIDYNDLIDLQNMENPALIIISVDIKSIRSALRITDLVKKQNKKVKVMWCSIGISFHVPIVAIQKEKALDIDKVDYIFYDNEIVLNEFFDQFFSNQPISSDGIGFKKNGKKVFNPYSNNKTYIRENYNAINIEDYIWRWGHEIVAPPYQKRQRILPIVTGVGCAYSCTFCINSNKCWKKLFRIKPKKMLLSQMRELIEKYDPDIIYFEDDNSFIQKERIEAALNLVIKYDKKWVGQGRGEYFREDYLNDDFFKKYFKDRCLWFGIGFETFSDDLRNKLNKNATTVQLERAAQLCDKYDIPFNPALIYGTVEETVDEFKSDLLKLVEFHKKYPKTTFSFQLWRPYPGTKEFFKVQEKSFIKNYPEKIEDWINYEIDYKTHGWLSPRFKRLILFARFFSWRFFTYDSFGKYWYERIVFKKLVNDFKNEKLFFFKIYRLIHNVLRRISK